MVNGKLSKTMKKQQRAKPKRSIVLVFGRSIVKYVKVIICNNKVPKKALNELVPNCNYFIMVLPLFHYLLVLGTP